MVDLYPATRQASILQAPVAYILLISKILKMFDRVHNVLLMTFCTLSFRSARRNRLMVLFLNKLKREMEFCLHVC